MSVKISVGGVLKSVSEIHTAKSSVVKTVEKGHCRVSGVTRQFFGKLENIDSFEIVLYSVSVNKTSNGTASSVTKPIEYGTHTWGNASLSIQSTSMTASTNGSANIDIVAQAYLKFTDGTRKDVRDLFATSDSHIILNGRGDVLLGTQIGSGGSQSIIIFGTKINYSPNIVAPSWTADSVSIGQTTEHFLRLSASNDSSTKSSRSGIKNLSATVDDVSYPISIVLS